MKYKEPSEDKTAIYKPMREAPEEINCIVNLILHFQPPEQKINFLLFKPKEKRECGDRLDMKNDREMS